MVCAAVPIAPAEATVTVSGAELATTVPLVLSMMLATRVSTDPLAPAV
jgi:hypothetical protein